MSAVAHRLHMDDRDSFDVQYLRDAIRACLSPGGAVAGAATFADMQTSPHRVKGERKLSRPKGVYFIEVVNRATGEVDVVSKVKPAHGQWSTTTHATATRAAGRSMPPIEERAYRKRYTVHALWSLEELHVCSLIARYGATRRRTDHIQALAQALSRRFRGSERRATAKVFAILTLRGLGKDDVRRTLEISPEYWRASRVRRLYAMVVEMLTVLDVQALRAWESECDAIMRGSR